MIFAMTGGAYAVTGGGRGGSHASAQTAAKKKGKSLKGQRGPAGPRGPEGKQGLEGKAGSNGKDGSNGTDGASATTESFAGKAHSCEEGGVVVKSASPETTVCNGKAGQTGFTETLPSGKSETGMWSVHMPKVGTAGEETVFYIPISFSIPLAEELSEESGGHALVVGQGEGAGEEKENLPKGCQGNYKEPAAEPGYFCAFVSYETGITYGPIAFDPVANGEHPFLNAGKYGTMLSIKGKSPGGEAYGDWVVTAPES
jgi:hypothetical protein